MASGSRDTAQKERQTWDCKNTDLFDDLCASSDSDGERDHTGRSDQGIAGLSDGRFGTAKLSQLYFPARSFVLARNKQQRLILAATYLDALMPSHPEGNTLLKNFIGSKNSL